MSILRLLAVAATLVTRSAFGAAPVPLLPPPLPHAEPSALPRSPVEERHPLELFALGRALASLGSLEGNARDRSTGAGAGAGVGFRGSSYFSFGGEGSLLRVSHAGGGAAAAYEGAVFGRVYLLESGALDPYLELAFGYVAERRGSSAAGALAHGPSARAGGGLDVVVLSSLRVGWTLAYREVLERSSSDCALGCSARAHGAVLSGVTVTLPLGDPL